MARLSHPGVARIIHHSRPISTTPPPFSTAMPRHDYDLPPDYEQRVAEGTMSEWYTRERAKRRAARQDTAWRRRYEQTQSRLERIREAASETVSILR